MDQWSQGSIARKQKDPKQPYSLMPKCSPTGDLDADGLKAFQIDLQLYRDALAKYTKEDEAVISIKTWVLNTVSVHWRTTACQPTETLLAWHRKLEEHVGITEERLQDHLGEHYRKVLNTCGGRVSNWETWIQDWERALNVAREKNVPEATHAPMWFRQLLTALVYYYESLDHIISNPEPNMSTPREHSSSVRWRTISGTTLEKTMASHPAWPREHLWP